MNCEHFSNCGFISWLHRHRPNIELEDNQCPKEEQCIRLNPMSDIAVSQPGLQSREETEIANPVIYKDKSGRDRRV